MRAYGRAQWVLVRLGFQVVEVSADHLVSTLSQASRVKCPMAYGGEDDDGHHIGHFGRESRALHS